jgi:hypothetical protein
MRYYRKMLDKSLPLDDDKSDTEEHVARGSIRLREFEEGGRYYEEQAERQKARAEARAPVLPAEKYYFGKEAKELARLAVPA